MLQSDLEHYHTMASAWKSSLGTMKRLRLDWTKTGKRLDQQSWSFKFENKRPQKTGLYGQV